MKTTSKKCDRKIMRGLRMRRFISGRRAGDVAVSLGVGKSTYYRWEQCDEGVPPEAVRALARLFGCSQSELESVPEIR